MALEWMDIVDFATLKKLLEKSGCELDALGGVKRVGPGVKLSNEEYSQLAGLAAEGRITANVRQALLTPWAGSVPATPAGKPAIIPPQAQPPKKIVVQPTFQELLVACNQAYVNHQFTEQNFPLEPMADDEKDWEVIEYHFNVMIYGRVAFRSLEMLGFRTLQGSRRAMEFIIAHPDIQRDRGLIATISWQDRETFLRAPVFGEYYDKSGLYLAYLDNDFSPEYGWLVLRHR